MTPQPPSDPDHSPAPAVQASGEVIAEQARQWFVALLDRPEAAQISAATAWRNADPAHEAAWRRIEAGWQAAGHPAERLARSEAAVLEAYLTAMDRRKSRKRTGIVLAALVSLGLAGGVWLERPNLLQDMTADHITARGERRSVTLDDGTTVLLDADSALAVEFGPDNRHVRLLRGAAFFDVAHSPVPFTVAAAGGEVRVMGTGFDLRLLEDAASVTLDHGSIAVTSGSGAPVILQPGETALFDGESIGPVETAALEDTLSWRGGRYVFYQARLADVLAEIGRYRPGRIVVTSSALGNERVTGSFALEDTSAALASLQASVGFRMDILAGRLVVISE